jgi:hypothetical protein
MTHLPVRLTLAGALLAGAAAAHAQSTLAELLEKGAVRLTKADLMAMMPARVESVWPNRQGEEDLLLSEDGRISGKGYHYNSRSESAVEGRWNVEDDGRFCTPKTFLVWNSRTNECRYVFRLGTDYFGAQKAEPDARVLKAKSFAKVAPGQ